VLDLTIGVANTVAQSWSGPISCDSLFPVAQALHPNRIEVSDPMSEITPIHRN